MEDTQARGLSLMMLFVRKLKPHKTLRPTPAPTATPKPVATATPAPMTHIPQTSDTFPLALLIAILAISGGAVALLIVGKKRKK